MPILSFWGSVWFGEKPKNQKKTQKNQKKPMPIHNFPETKDQKDPKKTKKSQKKTNANFEI